MKARQIATLTFAAALGLFGVTTATMAAEPPDVVNYQGILRDASGVPENGSFDMVFRFFDDPAAGVEILVDSHEAAGSGAVTVTGGLFNVGLGSGTVSDGIDFLLNDPYGAMTEVFRDYQDVWMEITIDGEVLSPRVKVVSAAYALNADRLDGKDGSELLDTSAAAQVKSGDLTVGNLTVSGGDISGIGSLQVDDIDTGFGPTEVFPMNQPVRSTDLVHFLGVNTGQGYNFVFPMDQPLRTSDNPLFTTVNTGQGNAEVYFMDQPVRTTDLVTFLGVNTGQGFNFVFPMDQPVRTSDNVLFSTVNTGQGDAEVYFMDQPVRTIDPVVFSSVNTGQGANQLYPMDQPVRTTDPVVFSSVNTGQGANQIYPMDQPVRTTDSVVFLSVNTGPGITEVHLMNQNIRTVDNVQFSTVNTGQGANELYAMDQAVRTTDPVAFATVDTGPGATEVHLMNQNIRSTDNVRFNAVGIGTAPSANPLTFPLALGEKISLYGAYGFGIQGSLLQIKTDIAASDIAFGYGSSASFTETLRVDQSNSNYVILDANPQFLDFCASCDGNASADGGFAWYEDSPADLMMQLQGTGDLFLDGGVFPNAFDLAESFWAGRPLAPGTVVRVDPARPDAVVPTDAPYEAAMLGVVSTRPAIVLGGHAFDLETLRRNWGDAIVEEFESQRADYRDRLLGEDAALRERDGMVGPMAAFESASAGTDRSVPGSEYEKARVRHEAEVERRSLTRFFEQHFVAVALSGRAPVLVDASFGTVEPGDYLTASPIPGIAMKATGSGPVLGTALESLSEGREAILAFVHRGDHVEPDGIARIDESQRDLAAAVDERTPDPLTGVQALAGNLQVVLDRNADSEARFSVFRDGQRGLDGELMRLDEEGNLLLKGALRPDAMDIAEYFPVSEAVSIGDVLTVDRDNPGLYRLAATAGDRAVVGVVSSRPGVVLGSGIERVAASDLDLARQLDDARQFGDDAAESRIWAQLERRFRETHAAVALTGTILIKVDAGYGDIRPGDLLVSSPTRGHAMRSDEPELGTVIGKALEPLDHGTGTIRALVMMR